MADAGEIRIGSFQLDPVGNRLLGGANERALSPLATRFLALLADRPGEPVPRAEIIRVLWADNHLVGENALNRLVSETRAALEDSPRAARIIQTVPRVGYRLVNEAAGDKTVPVPAPASTAPPLWQRLLFWLIIIAVTAAALNWVLETATGLVWVINHPN